MKQIAFVFALAFASVSITASAQASFITAQTAPVVGVYDRTSIVVAFYRSPLWAAILADRQFELDAAKKANDAAKVKELEEWGGERQNLAMEQMAGKAPIDNILAVLQPELKQLSSRMKLGGIVDSATVEPGASTVDLTSALMDWLKASFETRRMIDELHGQNPTPK